MGNTEFNKLPDELQEEIIKSKKSGTWISPENPIDTLTKKLSYLKYKLTKY
jgi:hypothetical protein